MTQDPSEWVLQEISRTLAQFFDRYPDDLIIGARLMMGQVNDLEMMQLISHRATVKVVHDNFKVIATLLSGIDETNVVATLTDTVNVLTECQKMKIRYAEPTLRIYEEFLELHQMRTVEEIAQYGHKITFEDAGDPGRFKDTIEVLQRLSSIADALGTYLRRGGLGDRLASLLEVITDIERLQTDINHVYFRIDGHRTRFPDYPVLNLLTVHWRSIVTDELRRLRGHAELRPEVKTKTFQSEDQVVVLLEIQNVGRSPADNITIELHQDDSFELIGTGSMEFEIVPSQGSITVEFTISPRTVTPYLSFDLTYDDAESKSKKLAFGDRLEKNTHVREFITTPNPYHAGTALAGKNKSVFYGREQELRYLQQSLISYPTNVVVVLYGQRRSGKTSLLYQLAETDILKPHIPIYIDMQNISLGLTTSEFLYRIAYAISKGMNSAGINTMVPEREQQRDFTILDLDRYLDHVGSLIEQRAIVLMIDEFEIIESKVSDGSIEPEIFHYLRSLMQHRSGINFLFAGVDSIQQLTRDYWSVFFNIAHLRKLSSLDEQASIRLITEPVQGYLEFDPFAVEKIRRLTGDQPYFIQLICYHLVFHCNETRKNYATINDINTVLKSVMLTGASHFRYAWDIATSEERVLLAILAQKGGSEGKSLSLIDIQQENQRFGLSYDYQNALQRLIDRDLVQSSAGGTKFNLPVGLIREWIRQEKPIKRVILEQKSLAV